MDASLTTGATASTIAGGGGVVAIITNGYRALTTRQGALNATSW